MNHTRHLADRKRTESIVGKGRVLQVNGLSWKLPKGVTDHGKGGQG